jgi:hypothetical protein
MSRKPVFSEPRVLIFDTGPLWELILYSAVHDLGFLSLKPELQHLQKDSSYEKLSEFVAGFQRRTTTPHVVAEISSRVIRTEPKGQSAIWGLVYTEFSSMRMDEGVMKLLEMPQKMVANIGAVDVSVLQLGLSFEQPKSLVLSVDRPLIAECKRAGVNVKDLWEVIFETTS